MQRERLIESLKEALRGRPEIAAAYLFGSQATGRTWKESDVDVAVVLAAGAPREARARFDLRLDLMTVLSRAAHRETDVIDLEAAPPLLAFEAIRNGILIFSRDERRRVEVAARALMRYWDTKPLRKTIFDAMNRRLTEGTFGHIEGRGRYTLEAIRGLSRRLADLREDAAGGVPDKPGRSTPR